AGYPHARADALHNQIARHFKQKVTDEEDSSAQAKNIRSEVQGLIQLQCCKADVDAIKVRNDVQQEHERNEAARQLGKEGRLGNCLHLFHVIAATRLQLRRL